MALAIPGSSGAAKEGVGGFGDDFLEIAGRADGQWGDADGGVMLGFGDLAVLRPCAIPEFLLKVLDDQAGPEWGMAGRAVHFIGPFSRA